MTKSEHRNNGRRAGSIAVLTLTLMGAAATAAWADPDTSIQKPGRVANQVA